MITVYGIPNCDTVKKAKSWLDQNGIAYTSHNYKTQGIVAEKLQQWLLTFGQGKLVNRAGTTWKKLSDEAKTAISSDEAAINLLASQPSIIKRPLIEKDGTPLLIGFNETEYRAKLLLQ